MAVLLAARIASLSDILPSAPLFDRSAEMEVVVPSATSLVVSTVNVLTVSLSVLITDTSLGLIPL